jgi:hypothetical protein
MLTGHCQKGDKGDKGKGVKGNKLIINKGVIKGIKGSSL